MHTCYSLCTSEVLNIGLSTLNHHIRLLLSLRLQRRFTAKQLGKRPLMNKWDKYLYPLIQNITVGGKLSKFGVTGRVSQGDRTLRSIVHITVSDRAVSSDRTLTCVWSSPTGRARSAKCPYGCSLMLIGRRHPSVRSVLFSVRSVHDYSC